METKKSLPYLIYWHKVANSGIWGYEDKNIAERSAESLAEQENVYTVLIMDMNNKTITHIKGDNYHLESITKED